MSFEEKTWEWAITPEGPGPGDRAPIEGLVGKPDELWRAQILEILEKNDYVEFLVFVQNIDMSSSQFGSYNVVLAGNNFTWGAKEIEALKENPTKYWYGNTPSERMYPQWYISRENHLKAKVPVNNEEFPWEDEEDICPKTGKRHKPDWNNVYSESDGGTIYIDVRCQDCGRNGCVGSEKTLNEEISW